MKAVKYLFALWVGVLVYVCFAVIFGAKGFSAFSQLENEQRRIEANLENLKLVNRELEDARKTLLYDRDTLAVYAREQGYASPSEKFIRIVGLTGNYKTRTSAGEVISAAEPQYTPERTIRIIAFCMGMTIFFCMAVFDVLKFLKER